MLYVGRRLCVGSATGVVAPSQRKVPTKLRRTARSCRSTAPIPRASEAKSDSSGFRAQTGSWFAHAKDDQLWLDRLELRLDDGEITVLNLDQYTAIEAI